MDTPVVDEFAPGLAVEVVPGIRRVVAPNPGRMTGPGTNTYLVGRQRVLVVDAGPALPEHHAAIERAIGDARVEGVLVTHTHRDHSPASAYVARRYGARRVGRLPRHPEFHDPGFVSDEVPDDGALYDSDDGPLVAIGTPGHASNHVCWYHRPTRALLTGDHVLGTVSPVILPPDGNMTEYLDSLSRLLQLDVSCILPGHGAVLRNPPRVLQGLIAHRLAREAKAVAALGRTPATLDQLLGRVYDDVDPALHEYARYSLLAHLEKLHRESRALRDGEHWRAA